MNAGNLKQNEAFHHYVASVSDELRVNACSFIGGEALQSACAVSADHWNDFADCWNQLTLDQYMGDNGTYRFRRYGEFELDHPEGTLRQLPHGPYEQPSYINPLNGGIKRYFDPLEQRFVDNPFLNDLLRSLADICNRAQGENSKWNIRLHPYRIRANKETVGKPTPEGIHRDGVDFIVTLMIGRNNVMGGQTSITDPKERLLYTYTLTHPMDMVVANDALTMHGVSPIRCDDPERAAWRDVLVIAFTRIPQHATH